jgi:PAS domain S-box-containing protein
MELDSIENIPILNKVFEQPSMGIVIVSPTFTFEKVNKAFADMVGYSEEELKQKTFVEITHPEHVGQDVENVKKLQNGEIPFYRTEKRYIKKNGEIFWAETFVSYVKDEKKGAQFFVTFIQDITKRKFDEDLLRAANEVALERELKISSQKEEIEYLKNKITKLELKK